MPTGRTRRLGVRVLVVLASAVLLLALTAAYVRRAAVDDDQFANRAEAALRDERVRDVVAERVTDEIVLRQDADLIAARPLIETVVGAVVSSRPFGTLFRAGVRDVHRAVFDRDRDTVTLTVADVGTVVAAGVQVLRPGLARKVRRTGRIALLTRDLGSVGGDLTRAADTVRLLSVLLLLAFLVLAGGVLALAADRRRAVLELGCGVAAAGVVGVVALHVLRGIALRQLGDPDARAAAAGVWDAFLGDLRTATWILAGTGAVVAAAAGSLLRPVDIGEPLRRLAARLGREPERPAWRALRGVALVAAGVLVLVDGDAVLSLLLTLAGVYLVWAGVTALLRLTYRAPDAEAAEAPRARRRRPLVVVVATALVVAVVVTFLAAGGVTTPAPARATGCNGHAVLCDRPLAAVALPATHNSMSAALPGWYSAEHEGSIPDQLAYGIRGLLIDTHYGTRVPGGGVRTGDESLAALKADAARDGVSPSAVKAALRIRSRLGFSGEGKREAYLCHSFCELGATPLRDVLVQIHDFLVGHPDAVLVIVVEDEVTPADFVAAARDAGLERFAYAGPIDTRQPTLGTMVRTGRRVVFLAEKQGGGAPWYRSAYAGLVQETPYAFKDAKALIGRKQLAASCAPNRGTATAPLFLLNHWVTTDPLPKPSIAEEVNAYGRLLARARECERIRHHIPNLIAVNYYDRGALLRVADTLNEVR